MSDQPTLRALLELREAKDLNASALVPAWLVVKGVLEARARMRTGGMPVGGDREDAVAASLVKVMRGIGRFGGDTEAAARRWLHQIYDRTLTDLFRKRQRQQELFEQGTDFPDDALFGYFDPRQDDELAAEPDPAALGPYEDALWDRVDEHIAASVRRHARVNARRNAEVAYERLVRGRSAEQVVADLEIEVRRDRLYQWSHRGRDGVLLPVLRAWIAEAGEDSAEGRFATQLLTILQASVRRDAGQPRPGRRKGSSPSEPP